MQLVILFCLFATAIATDCSREFFPDNDLNAPVDAVLNLDQCNHDPENALDPCDEYIEYDKGIVECRVCWNAYVSDVRLNTTTALAVQNIHTLTGCSLEEEESIIELLKEIKEDVEEEETPYAEEDEKALEDLEENIQEAQEEAEAIQEALLTASKVELDYLESDLEEEEKDLDEFEEELEDLDIPSEDREEVEEMLNDEREIVYETQGEMDVLSHVDRVGDLKFKSSYVAIFVVCIVIILFCIWSVRGRCCCCRKRHRYPITQKDKLEEKPLRPMEIGEP